MKRKLIIDGNAVYEIDEDCMVQKCLRKAEQNADELAENMNGKGKPKTQKEETISYRIDHEKNKW